MKKDYHIGAHQFETEEEYLCAIKDYDYIQRFMEELNVHEPQVAKELYDRLKNNTTFMKTELGEAFKDKLVQLFVADLIEKKKTWIANNNTMTMKEYIQRITKELPMKWFFRGFLVGNGLMLLSMLCKVICICIETFSDKAYDWLSSMTSVVTACCGIWNSCWIIVSIAFLGLSYTRMLHKKVEPMHKFNLLFVCGAIMCAYVWILSMIRV